MSSISFGLHLCALVILVGSPACASVQTGPYGAQLDAAGRRLPADTTRLGLKVSARELDDYSSPYFGQLAVTFENTTARWVRIRSMRVRFANDAQNRAVMIPWGDELDSWTVAAGLQREIRQHNTQLSLSGLALGGAALSALSDSSVSQIAGGAVAAGSLTALAIDEVADDAQRLQRPGPFPRSHLLAVPFDIPPGLFARRWIVLNTPGHDPALGCITTMIIGYETEPGQRERVAVEFRSAPGRSEWQRSACKKRRHS
jgi:hypothetical protein